MRTATTSVVAALLLAFSAAAADGTALDLDWGTPTASHARMEPAAGSLPLEVRFEPADWPSVVWRAPEGMAWDFATPGALLLRLENPGREPVAFNVRIDDDVKADGVVHCLTARGTIEGGATELFAVPTGPDPMSLGMRGLPGPAEGRSLPVGRVEGLDLSHVVAFQLFLDHPKAPAALRVHEIRLATSPRLEGMVDELGQFAHADWPGKIADEADLRARRDAERAELAAAPAMPGRNRFGGWAEGPELEATGFFRVAKHDGRWWLVDPEGRLFFSSGIDCVTPNNETIVTGRESMFASLPEPSDPLARYFGRTGNVLRGPVKSGRTFDFYRANLARKYGEEPLAAWAETALKRLPAWGFNTIGNWSSPDFARNGKVPYVATAGVGGDHARVSSGEDYWGKMHDPFDPKFAESVRRGLEPVVARVKGDPWCVGYFVDNEIAWGGFDLEDPRGRIGLALGALKEPSSSPARKALVAQLRSTYETIEKLNAAWGTRHDDWSVLESGELTAPSPMPAAMQTDLRAFVKSLATRYFTTIRDELRRLDPEHLYLGCRFAWKTREAVEAAAETCEVLSFNIYDRSVDPAKWGFLAEFDRPCLIGEFHVGALDRGMLHTGLVSSSSQEERAAVFKGYVESVLDHPSFVGCHWFQYADQALTGRSLDGENYNIGFVTITDTPYPEMVEAAREVHRGMYERRAGGQP